MDADDDLVCADDDLLTTGDGFVANGFDGPDFCGVCLGTSCSDVFWFSDSFIPFAAATRSSKEIAFESPDF